MGRGQRFLALFGLGLTIACSFYIGNAQAQVNEPFLPETRIGDAVTPTPVDGACGAALNSCLGGTFQDDTDSATEFRWFCAGANGGATLSCSMPKPTNGGCGAAARMYAASDSGFIGAFCSSGNATPASPAFPAQDATTSWACSGTDGGADAHCSAYRAAAPINGACGSAAQPYASNASGFSGDLCASGSATPASPSFPAQGGSVSWTCAGANGGVDVNCSASRAQAPVAGSCGAAAQNYASTAAAYSGAFCSAGTASPVSPAFPARGASASWSCSGANGGASANCVASRDAAPAVNGACGTAAAGYGTTVTAYSGTFCSSGTANPATPAFPAQGASVSWTCRGADGGTDATCTASRGAAVINGACGNAATTYGAALSAYSGTFCSSGTANPATPAFPAQGASVSWTCAGANGGTTATCSASRALAPVNGACGGAAASYAYNVASYSAAFCSSGTANPATPAFPAQGSSVSWTCAGANGGSNAACSASRALAPVNGACGGAAATYAYNVAGYSAAFCSSGSANPGTPAFPAQGASVSWTCAGTNGGTTAACSASRALAPVNGACGGAANSYAYNIGSYSAAFCATGAANPASPAFPAQGATVTWTCSGANGGAAASCAASRAPAPVNAACGPAATNYVYNAGGFSGALCSAGTASPASPGFPAMGGSTLWSCFGSNGGTNLNCVATRSPAPVNGVCAAANNTCAAGTAADLPDGPARFWWNCAGLYGGTTATCSQMRPVNGVCAAAKNTCAAGTFVDVLDSTTLFRWQCAGLYNGSTANYSSNKPCYYQVDIRNFHVDSNRNVSWYDLTAAGGSGAYACLQQKMAACSVRSGSHQVIYGNDALYCLRSALGFTTRPGNDSDFGYWTGGWSGYGWGARYTNPVYHISYPSNLNAYASRGTIYMDASCNVTSSPGTNICGAASSIDIFVSPVSLVWKQGNTDETITTFAVDPAEKDKWFTWRGSDIMPLVVYDPSHSGTVKDGSQLFGHYTFGKRWDNGFDALGSLDADKNGKVDGDELKPLALWFDSNRDGKSDPGEIKDLVGQGVTSLSYLPAERQQSGTDIVAEQGYTRQVDGKSVTGPAIDWFARMFTSKEKASSEAKKELAPEQSSFNGNLGGVWLWKTNDVIGGSLRFGALGFQQEGARIIGESYTEGKLMPNAKNMKSVIQVNPLNGIVSEEGGQRIVNFTVTGEDGLKTFSTASLSADGRTLTGRSKAERSKDDASGDVLSVDYTWTAVRAGE